MKWICLEYSFALSRRSCNVLQVTCKNLQACASLSRSHVLFRNKLCFLERAYECLRQTGTRIAVHERG